MHQQKSVVECVGQKQLLCHLQLRSCPTYGRKPITPERGGLDSGRQEEDLGEHGWKGNEIPWIPGTLNYLTIWTDEDGHWASSNVVRLCKEMGGWILEDWKYSSLFKHFKKPPILAQGEKWKRVELYFASKDIIRKAVNGFNNLVQRSLSSLTIASW